MDITRTLALWEKLGMTTNDYYDEDGNYVIDFINKNDQVVGWFKVYSGQGIRWSYPDEFLSL
jgi:hypothetical protein